MKRPRTKKVQMRGFIIAIDGPAGAGKSTVSRLLADSIEGKLLDTGAMYRSVAYFGIKKQARSEEEFVEAAREIKFTADPVVGNLLVNGEDLGSRIRTQRVSDAASKVSAFPKIRKLLTREQRRLAKKMSHRFPIVVEGRDIGTVVFPDVEFKFFVTADPKVRARRRYQQLKKQGVKGISLKKIIHENEKRDKRDSGRKVAPLKCPEDAIVVDTTRMSTGQVVKFLCQHIKAKIELT